MARQPPQAGAAPPDKWQRWLILSLLAGSFVLLGDICLIRGQIPAPTPKTRQLTGQPANDRPGGSLYTVTADAPLADYSSNQSGNRFYVTIPEADATRLSGLARGRGYEEMQVLRQGRAVVLVFQLQPGAKAHVNQRSNRLDVVFTTPEGLPDGTIYQPESNPTRLPAQLPVAPVAPVAPGVFPPPARSDTTRNNNLREPVAPNRNNDTERPLATPPAAAPVAAQTVSPENANDAIAPSNIPAVTPNPAPVTAAQPFRWRPLAVVALLAAGLAVVAAWRLIQRARRRAAPPVVPADAPWAEGTAVMPLAAAGAGNDMRVVPIWVASRIRCASPPDRVWLVRLMVR